MAQSVQAELLTLIQAGLGWAVMATRSAAADAKVKTRSGGVMPTVSSATEAPVRLRATITIDIEAADADAAEQQIDAVRGQFEGLRRAHPFAELTVQRRKPRTSPRPPTPARVMIPYADD